MTIKNNYYEYAFYNIRLAFGNIIAPAANSFGGTRTNDDYKKNQYEEIHDLILITASSGK